MIHRKYRCRACGHILLPSEIAEACPVCDSQEWENLCPTSGKTYATFCCPWCSDDPLQVNYDKAVVWGRVCLGIFTGSGLLHAFLRMSNGSASLFSLVTGMILYFASGLILVWVLYLKSRVLVRISMFESEGMVLHDQAAGLKMRIAAIEESNLAESKEQSKVSEMSLKLTEVQNQHKAKLVTIDAEFAESVTKIESDFELIELLEKEELYKLEIEEDSAIEQCDGRIKAIDIAHRAKVIQIQGQLKKVEEDTEELLVSRRLAKHKKMLLEMCKAPIESGKIDGWMSSVSKLHSSGIHDASDIYDVSWRPEVGLICMRTDGIRVKIHGISKRMTENLNGWLLNVRYRAKVDLSRFEIDSEELGKIVGDEAEEKSRLSEILRLTEDQYAVDHSAEASRKLSQQQRFKELWDGIKVKFDKRRKKIYQRRQEIENLYAAKYRETLEPLDIFIKELEEKIAKQNAAIMNRMKYNELLKGSLETELLKKNDSLMHLNLQISAHQVVCFRHYLSRLFR